MAQSQRPGVTIIGAGNVGSSLALALAAERYPIVSVVSRTGGPALKLARKVNCKRVSTNIADTDPKSEVVIIATPDSAIAGVARELAALKGLRFRKLCGFTPRAHSTQRCLAH
jgi:prephenate dehydrogenase